MLKLYFLQVRVQPRTLIFYLASPSHNRIFKKFSTMASNVHVKDANANANAIANSSSKLIISGATYDADPQVTSAAKDALQATQQFYSSAPTVSSLTSNPYITGDVDLTTTPCPYTHPMHFTVDATQGYARASRMTLPHGTVHTPVFMPVGTQGTIKGITSDQMAGINTEILLGNTYHLALRPGPDALSKLGGLHQFMNWHAPILTDSGGFQMVSLVKLATFTEAGVEFISPRDQTPMLLTPELSIHTQNLIGADIMMALDDVVSSTIADEARFILATQRTIRWLDRCIKANVRPTQQNIFAIVQGGIDPKLREQCLKDILARDAWLPGYAIGGLAGGEAKEHFWRVVFQCAKALPVHKPRYCMGVGYPLDLVVCVALGIDAFDCVYPCRTARFGTAIVPEGMIHLRKSRYTSDPRPLDENCSCVTCQQYSRAFLSTIAGRTAQSCHLITIHNLTYMKRLMSEMRQSIIARRFPAFVNNFLSTMFPDGDGHIPTWVREALAAAEVPIDRWGDDVETAQLKAQKKGSEESKEEMMDAETTHE